MITGRDLYGSTEAARDARQAARMTELGEAGECLLCGPPGGTWDVVDRTEHWVIARNAFPYEGALHHLLLSPRRHVSRLLDLTEEEYADSQLAIKVAAAHVGTDTFSVGIRNGDTELTGGTIAHLHAHLIVAEVEGPPVRFRMSGRASEDVTPPS